MDKEQILSTLKAKLGQTSLSERTLNDYIANTMPKEGEPDDSWYETHSNILKSINGNFNHDVAAQVDDFKKNYKPNPQDNKPDPEPQPNAEMDAMKQQLQQMMDMMKGMQNKSVEDNLRNSVLSQSDALGANKGLWEMAVSQTKIEENMNQEAFLSAVKGNYETYQKNVFGSSAAPYGNNGDPDKEGAAEMDAFFKSKGGVWADGK